MPNEKIQLLAKAKLAGIEGYRRMSEDELRTALVNAQGTKANKGKSLAKASTNGSTTAKGKTKGKTVTPAKGKSSPAKGKTTTSKSAPAKSTRKAAVPAKGKAQAAKGVQAKRPTAARGKGKASVAKTPGAVGTRAALGKINWNKPSNVGTTGKRKDVLDALREHKGDKAAAFKSLKRKATRYYPEKDQYEAERMLVWLIGRVAYDYAFKTGQHEPAERAAYGTSTRAADVKRREERAKAHKPRRAAKTAGKGRSKATTAKGRKTAPVASKGRSKKTASKGRR